MRHFMVFCLAVLMSMTALADGKSEESKKSATSDANSVAQVKSLKKRVEALEAVMPVASVTLDVNCNAGESINDALQTNALALDITYSGTCFENVLVSRGKVTLTGAPGAVVNGSITADISGGTLLLNSATIQASNATGLSVMSDSRVLAVALNVSGAAGNGVIVNNGFLRCADCTSNNNAGDGMTVILGGRLLLAGTLELNNNQVNGLQVLDSGTARTTLDPLGAGSAISTNAFDISGNAQFGLLIFGAAALFIDNITEMTVNQNANGIGVATGSTAHFMGSVIAQNNGVAFGVFGGNAFMRGTLDASNNNIGLFVSDNGLLRGEGTATVTANNIGFFNRAAYNNLAVINSTGNNNLAGLTQLGAVMNNGGGSITGDVACDGTELIGPSAGFVCGTN